MANIFQDILAKTSSEVAFNKSIVKATDWLNAQAKRTAPLNTQAIIKQMPGRGRSSILPGRMYLFNYDPLHKNDLPYYDRFPLVFPFRTVKGGFYALNMHYLPYAQRAILMDALYMFINNNKNNETTRLQLSYNLLNKFSRHAYIKPCVKHYLNKQVKSRFIYISPDEWNVALFLPLQGFKKANESKVYSDSLKIIRGA